MATVRDRCDRYTSGVTYITYAQITTFSVINEIKLNIYTG